jgi:hypothetical protein
MAEQYDELLNNEQSTQEQSEEVKVRMSDGKEYTLAEVEQWQKGNMLQSDYTRKQQELAEQRRNMESQLTDYQNLKGMVSELQKRDPYFVAQAQRILSGQPVNQDPLAEDPVLGTIVKRLQNAEQAINAWGQHTNLIAEKQEAIILEKEMAHLAQKYPRMSQADVINAIMANPDVDTDVVAKQSHEAMTARLNSELQALANQNRTNQRAVGEGSGGRTTGILKPLNVAKMSMEEINKAALEKLNQAMP